MRLSIQHSILAVPSLWISLWRSVRTRLRTKVGFQGALLISLTYLISIPSAYGVENMRGTRANQAQRSSSIPKSSSVSSSVSSLSSSVPSTSSNDGNESQKDKDHAPKMVAAAKYKVLIMGTIVSKKKDVALIKEMSTKKVKAVRVGDLLLDKYPILSIQKNHMTIQDGPDPIVLLKNQFAASNIATTKTRKTHSSDQTYRELGLDRTTRKDEIDIKITGAYRDNIINNQLQKILMEAAATPQTKNNRIIGFELTDITPGSIFEKAGFTNGDLIKAINSTPLNSPTTAIKILHSLKKENSVDVSILRNGTEMNMTISVN